MRVLLMADGSSVHTVRYQTELKNQNVDVLLVSLEKGKTVDINLPQFTGIKVIDYFVSSFRIKRIVDEYCPDIINPHFASGYGFMTARSGIERNVPVLLHCLGSDVLISPKKSALHRKRAAIALSRADRVAVDSEYLGQEVRRLYAEVKYDVIAWGADSAAFEQYRKKDNVVLSRIRPLKILVPRPHYRVYNNRFILDALKDLVNGGRISITFPDRGEDFRHFAEIARKECPDGGIEYYSFLARDDYNNFMSKFDIYLSAARSDSSPASLIEAMAAGLYPVIGDIPGIREWVNDDNGCLFSLDDGESLRKAIQKIVDSARNLEEVLTANHARAAEKGRFSDNIRTTITLMEKMRDHA